MKKPDKIYVHVGPHLGLLNTTIIKTDAPGEEEYIRKDALIKWLDGKMTIEGATEGFIGGYDTALKDIINKINSI